MQIGIIGTNVISEKMLEAIRIDNDFKAHVVCSQKLENAKNFADKHNIKHYTNNYQDLLNYDLDAVYIAVPNILHYEIALFFLQNKVATFCEKPLASNYTEVKKLVEASQKYNTLLMEGVIPIYTPALSVIEDTLKIIGEVRSVNFSMHQYSSRYDAYRNNEILNAFKVELANGSLMDIGVYPLTVAIRLFGCPKRISAGGYLLETKVDGSGVIVLHYPTKDVMISHSKINNQSQISEIMGEDGIITINHLNHMNEVTLIKDNHQEVVYSNYETLPMYYEFKAFKAALDNHQIEILPNAHQLSLDVHKIITVAREIIGIKYSSDQ